MGRSESRYYAGWSCRLGTVDSHLRYSGGNFFSSKPVTLLNSALLDKVTASTVATIGNAIAAYVEYYMGTKASDLASFEHKKREPPLWIGEASCSISAVMDLWTFYSWFWLQGGQLNGGHILNLTLAIFYRPPWFLRLLVIWCSHLGG
jgi:membrane protein YqaA with SNARE-associated domain